MKKTIVVTITLFLLAGCSGSRSTAAVKTGKPETSASAPQETPETISEDTELSEALDEAKNAADAVTAGSYEEIYNEYAKKLTDATPGLINEYNTEASANTNGLDGLASISNAKVEKLAQIETEGTEKMAQFMYIRGSGKYDEYQNWAGKLYEVYDTEAKKIYAVYMSSVTG